MMKLWLVAALMLMGTATISAQNNTRQRLTREELADKQARHIAQTMAFDEATTKQFVETYTACPKEIWALGPRMKGAHKQANAQQQAQAEEMLSAIMQELGYVGVMAMECFVTPQGLLINELAPRVHNSGHWTQNGASISQFELHLRAITDLPLPQPVVNNPSVMINLIGSDANYDWLKLPLVHLHWYDKEVRPGRKVGHLNLTDSDTSRLTATLEALIPLLPPEYASGVIWAQSKFG